MRHRFVLFAVLAAIALALFAPASPASAQAAEVPPGLQTKINFAVLDATLKLEQRTECEALLSGRLTTGFSARDVLRTSRRPYVPVPPRPLPANTLASVAAIGSGLNQDIRIHNGFDEIGRSLTVLFEGRREFSTESLDVQRAVVILHEVGHLTGIEPQHENRRDEAGRPIAAAREEGLYNTRILNTCFAPRYLIAGASCQQNLFTFDSTYGNSPIVCSLTCRADAGPVVVSWTSSLQSTVTTDTPSSGGCHSTRVSACPPPSELVYTSFSARAVFPPTDITMTVTDSTGHVSEDTFRVTCTDPNFW